MKLCMEDFVSLIISNIYFLLRNFIKHYKHQVQHTWIRSKGIQGTLERACCTGHLGVCRGLDMWRKYRALYHFFFAWCANEWAVQFWLLGILNILQSTAVLRDLKSSIRGTNLQCDIIVTWLWIEEWGEWPGFGYLRSTWWQCNVEFLQIFLPPRLRPLPMLWEQR